MFTVRFPFLCGGIYCVCFYFLLFLCKICLWIEKCIVALFEVELPSYHTSESELGVSFAFSNQPELLGSFSSFGAICRFCVCILENDGFARTQFDARGRASQLKKRTNHPPPNLTRTLRGTAWPGLDSEERRNGKGDQVERYAAVQGRVWNFSWWPPKTNCYWTHQAYFLSPSILPAFPLDAKTTVYDSPRSHNTNTEKRPWKQLCEEDLCRVQKPSVR